MDAVENRTTARLRLHRMSLNHLEAVVTIDSDPRTNQHRPSGAPTPTQSETKVREWIRGWEDDGLRYWAVEYEQLVVGVVGIRYLMFRGTNCWNLYYRFSPDAWGKGFASEASREAVAVAEALEPGRPLVVRTRPANDPAVRVAESVGFHRRPALDSEGFIVLVRGWGDVSTAESKVIKTHRRR
jgi:ribosomal-protein-alanine N-acetyltransferase